MSELEDRIEIANPQHPHVATVLLLDVSGSMVEAGKIDQLNEGLQFFKEDVISDELARKRVDLAVITFGGTVNVAHEFSSVEEYEAEPLSASGDTPMGSAIDLAINLVEKRKQEYRDQGTDYYRPWIFMVTDGEPTDMRPGDSLWNSVVQKVYEGEFQKKFLFFAVGVEPANLDILKQISSPERAPVLLQQGKFKDMFEWLSKSQQAVSASRVGEQTQLATATGWAVI